MDRRAYVDSKHTARSNYLIENLRVFLFTYFFIGEFKLSLQICNSAFCFARIWKFRFSQLSEKDVSFIRKKPSPVVQFFTKKTKLLKMQTNSLWYCLRFFKTWFSVSFKCSAVHGKVGSTTFLLSQLNYSLVAKRHWKQ